MKQWHYQLFTLVCSCVVRKYCHSKFILAFVSRPTFPVACRPPQCIWDGVRWEVLVSSIWNRFEFMWKFSALFRGSELRLKRFPPYCAFPVNAEGAHNPTLENVLFLLRAAVHSCCRAHKGCSFRGSSQRLYYFVLGTKSSFFGKVKFFKFKIQTKLPCSLSI